MIREIAHLGKSEHILHDFSPQTRSTYADKRKGSDYVFFNFKG